MEQENTEGDLERLALDFFKKGVANLKGLERPPEKIPDSLLAKGITGVGYLQMANYYLLSYIIKNYGKS